MSGGVDSSVAAALLRKKGYDVVGVTMCFSPSGGVDKQAIRRKPSCCGEKSVDDARRVAHKLGIKHYVLEMHKYFNEYVIKDFCAQYVLGRTPNPCIVCNQRIKFGVLLNKIIALGGDFLATGHYARIARIGGTHWLKKARDINKDQSYFLYRLGQNEMESVMFPIGGYTKPEIRQLARKFSLPVADKKESQEICFIPQDDYRSFLKERIGGLIKPGNIIGEDGKILGRHEGVAFYTIGQRQGLGIAMGYPAYVIKIDRAGNNIVLGRRERIFSREFFVGNLHFAKGSIKKKVALKVKIRYNHKESAAEVIPSADKIRVIFKKPQFAITPGQAAVFYFRGRVLGGGTIEKVL